MPRRYDIETASAVVVEPNGRRTLRTVDFVRELKKVNWDSSLHDANAWIEASISTFKDISPAEGEARLFMRYNPNGGYGMGFPSRATDCIDHHISLDEKFIDHPVSTYFMRSGETYWREGILNSTMLVVDSL